MMGWTNSRKGRTSGGKGKGSNENPRKLDNLLHLLENGAILLLCYFNCKQPIHSLQLCLGWLSMIKSSSCVLIQSYANPTAYCVIL